MSPRPKLTDAQKERIALLREERSWSYARIASALGCHPGTVAYHCLAGGIHKPGAGPIPTWRQRTKPCGSGDRVIRPFSAEEDRRLTELSLAGITVAEISRRLGRGHTSVAARMATLARRDDRGFA